MKSTFVAFIVTLLTFTLLLSCSKKSSYDHLDQKPYYKVQVKFKNKSLTLKSTNGKTSNIRIRSWPLDKYVLGPCEMRIYPDSIASFFFLDYKFYETIAYQKSEIVADKFYEKDLDFNQDSLIKILEDSLRQVYPIKSKIKEIDLFNDTKTVFRKAEYWLKYLEEEYFLKDIIKPNTFYKINFGNPRYITAHVHNPMNYHDTFEFKTNDKNEIIYYRHQKTSRYTPLKSRL